MQSVGHRQNQGKQISTPEAQGECELLVTPSRRRWLQQAATSAAICLPGGGLWAADKGRSVRRNPDRPLRMVFLNPGWATEAYWLAASQAMQQAAQSLGVDLEVLYGDRNHMGSVQIAQNLVARAPEKRPDYVICCNEYSAGPELLRIFGPSRIPCFFAFSGIPDSLKEITGAPRQKFTNWLGSLEPDAEVGGYLSARALLQQALANPALHAPDGSVHLVALTGNRSTISSTARNQGMRRAVEEAKRVHLVQEVIGDWRRDKAKSQTEVLIKRYPHVRTFWGGNDLMAFGAMDAWREQGGQPGVNALFSGINTSTEALEALRKGSLSVLAGGHFMNGAWALVMLYDHAHGHDFRSEGLEMVRNMFVLFDPPMTVRFEQRLANGNAALDFRRYSKTFNPKMKQYQFDIKELLQA